MNECMPVSFFGESRLTVSLGGLPHVSSLQVASALRHATSYLNIGGVFQQEMCQVCLALSRCIMQHMQIVLDCARAQASRCRCTVANMGSPKMGTRMDFNVDSDSPVTPMGLTTSPTNREDTMRKSTAALKLVSGHDRRVSEDTNPLTPAAFGNASEPGDAVSLTPGRFSVFIRTSLFNSTSESLEFYSEQDAANAFASKWAAAKETGIWTSSRFCAKAIVASKVFDMMMGTVIITNSVMIGFEQAARVNREDGTFFATMENVFLCIYVIELALRFYGGGCNCLKDRWVKFDCLLVMCAIVSSYFTFLVGEWNGLEVALVFRVLRLARLAKMVRFLMDFRELWMLLQGLMTSASMIFYTLLLLVVILYIFAVIGDSFLLVTSIQTYI